ncbi:MAG: leucine-rich repeat protein, partial [Oscillospiraceae bacterium]|nr:leucine-rich repeat protein [Oscillospiraceae bacterium]
MGERVFTREDAKSLIRATSKAVKLPSDFTMIATGALAGFSQVTELVIPEGITRIASHAFFTRSFKGTCSMTHLSIPSTLKQFDRWCFYDCNALMTIDVPEDFPEQLILEMFSQCPSATVRFGKKILGASKKKTVQQIMDESSGILSLGAAALLTIEPDGALRIPSNYSIILPHAMRNMASRGIKKVVIPSSVKLISPNAFSFLNSLEEVIIAPGVEYIDNNAFAGCKFLKKVAIPESVTQIGAGAFMNCPSLEKIHLPSGLTEVPDEMFSGCRALKEVQFGGHVKRIGAGAFAGCTGIRGMMLPESVKTVGNSAFWECSTLQRLYVPAGCETVMQSAFGNCPMLSTLYMPRIIRDMNEHKRIFGDFSSPEITWIDETTERPEWDIENLPEVTDATPVPQISVPSYNNVSAGAGGGSVPPGPPITQIPSVVQTHPQKPVDAEAMRKIELMMVRMQGQMDKLTKNSAAVASVQGLAGADIAAISSLNQNLEALRSGFEAVKSLRDSTEQLNTLQQQIDTLTEMQSRMDEMVKIQEQVEAITEIKEKMDVFSEIQEKVDAITEMQEKVDAISEMQEKVDAISEMKEKVDAISEMKEKVDAISEMKEKVDAISEMQEKVDTIVGMQSQIEAISEMKDKVDAVSEMQSQIEAVSEMKDKVEAIADIQEKAAAFDALQHESAAANAIPVPQPVVAEIPVPQPVAEAIPVPQPVAEAIPAPQPVAEANPVPQPVVEAIPVPQPVTEANPVPQRDPSYEVFDSKIVFSSVHYGPYSENEKVFTHEKAKALEGPVERSNALKEYQIIGYRAFRNSQAGERFEIPEGVRRVERQAFWDCPRLMALEIPSTLTEIEPDAFSGCSRMTDAYLCNDFPDRRAVDLFLFRPEIKLHWPKKKILARPRIETVAALMEQYDDILTAQKAKKLIVRNHILEIPEGYSVLAPNCLKEVDIRANEPEHVLTTVFIPPSVRRITAYAFSGLETVTNIVLSEGIQLIEMNAFTGCTGPYRLILPNSVCYIGPYAFSAPCQYEEIRLPAMIREIPENAFTNCNTMVSLHIPDAVENVGDLALTGCSSLVNLTIPKRFEQRLPMIFDGPVKINVRWNEETKANYQQVPPAELLAIVEPKMNISEQRMFTAEMSASCADNNDRLKLLRQHPIVAAEAFAEMANSTKFEIPLGVLGLCSYAFGSNQRLMTLTIPKALSEFEYAAFSGCDKLRDIFLPEGFDRNAAAVLFMHNPSILLYFGNARAIRVRQLLMESPWILSSGEAADLEIQDGRMLVPNGYLVIASYMYHGIMGKVSLKKFETSSSVRVIGTQAFSQCGVEEIVCHNGLLAVLPEAFTECANLKKVILPDTVTFLGKRPFVGCGALEEVVIPKRFADRAGEILRECPKVNITWSENLPKGIVDVEDVAKVMPTPVIPPAVEIPAVQIAPAAAIQTPVMTPPVVVPPMTIPTPVTQERIPEPQPEIVPPVAEVIPQAVPIAAEEIPEIVEEIPEIVEEIPEIVEEIPEIVEEIPETVEEIPEIVEEIPEIVEEIPETVEEI